MDLKSGNHFPIPKSPALTLLYMKNIDYLLVECEPIFVILDLSHREVPCRGPSMKRAVRYNLYGHNVTEFSAIIVLYTLIT